MLSTGGRRRSYGGHSLPGPLHSPIPEGAQNAPGPLPAVLAPSFSSRGHPCLPESSASEAWSQKKGLLSHRHRERTQGRGAGVGRGMACTKRTLQSCSGSPVAGANSPHPVTGSPSASQVPTALGLRGAQPSGRSPSQLIEAASRAGTLLPAESGPNPVGALNGLPPLPQLPPLSPFPQQAHLRSAAKRLKPLYR